MKINSFIFEYYKQQCTPQPLHIPTMPEGGQAVMEAIRDEVVAIATRAQAEGNKALLKALAAVPTEFPELTKKIEGIDAEILKVSSDKLMRPKHGPDMGKLVDFAKRIGKVHASDLLAECGDDQGALQALLEVVKGRLTKLEAERRGLISFAEQMQESLVQAIGRALAPHLVQAAATAKVSAIR